MRNQIFKLIKEQSNLSWEQIVANIVVAGIIGFLIFVSYMISHRGTIYSKKFNVSLVIGMPLRNKLYIFFKNSKYIVIPPLNGGYYNL